MTERGPRAETAPRVKGTTVRTRPSAPPRPSASTAAAVAVADRELPLTSSGDWTTTELAAVRTELVTERERITGEVATLEAAITEMLRDSGDGAGDDQADTGSKAFEREQGMTLLANTRESLFQTEYALRRLREGTYGVCEGCGGPVGKARLQAFPRATQCVVCKQRQERH